MLFDLRSRGRRRTVQAVYLGLAVLMGGGLILFGVGSGNGGGGLLNAFTGNGSGSAQRQVVSPQEKAALKQTKLTPTIPTPGRRWSARAGRAPARAATSTAPPAHLRPTASRSSTTTAGLGALPAADQEARPQPGNPGRRGLRPARQLSGRGRRLGDPGSGQPDRGQRLRVPCRFRLRRQADPQGRSRAGQGPHPRAQSSAAQPQDRDRAAKTTPTIAQSC